MTIEELYSLNLPFANPTDETCLYVESALDWLKQNTNLEFDKKDIETVKALPAGAKLFLYRYGDIMGADTLVQSESIGGMSQSFKTSSRNDLLMDLANDLLSSYLKSSFSFVPAIKKWSE